MPKFFHSALFSLLLLSSAAVFSQNKTEEPQLVFNSFNEKVYLKVYSQELIYKEGINIYRSINNQNNYFKINKKPIKPLVLYKSKTHKYSKEEELLIAKLKSQAAKDKSIVAAMAFLVEGYNPKTKDANLFYLQALLKSFESEDVARALGILYVDSTAQVGTTYQYRIARIKNGREEILKQGTAYQHKETITEKKPIDIVIKKKPNRITFVWKYEPNRFWGMNIYRTAKGGEERKVNSKPILVSERTIGKQKFNDVFFQDDSVKTGEQYTYYLAGIDFWGNETERSEAFEINFKDQTPPQKVSNLKTSTHNLEITLTYQAPTDSDLLGFNLYRSYLHDSNMVLVNKTIIPKVQIKYSDVTPKPGLYYYQLASVDMAGNENPSFVVMATSIDAVPPAIPSKLSAKVDSGHVSLKWQANKEKDLLGYRIYTSANKGDTANAILINAIAITENHFEDTIPLHTKNKIYYRVASVDSALNVSKMSEPVFIQQPDITGPSAPFIEKTTITENKSIIVMWHKIYDSDAKKLVLQKSSYQDFHDFEIIAKELPITSTSFEDKNIVSKNIYYRLFAIDSEANSSKSSNVVYVNAINLLNQAPTTNSLKLDYKYIAKSQVVQLSWSLAESQNLKGMSVFRKKTSDPIWRPITGAGFDKTKIDDAGLSTKEEYFYEVRAYFTDGSVLKSNLISFQTK